MTLTVSSIHALPKSLTIQLDEHDLEQADWVLSEFAKFGCRLQVGSNGIAILVHTRDGKTIHTGSPHVKPLYWADMDMRPLSRAVPFDSVFLDLEQVYYPVRALLIARGQVDSASE